MGNIEIVACGHTSNPGLYGNTNDGLLCGVTDSPGVLWGVTPRPST